MMHNADFRVVRGFTNEGFPFHLVMQYAPGAPGDAEPIAMEGSYDAKDGSSSFRIEPAPDGNGFVRLIAEVNPDDPRDGTWVLDDLTAPKAHDLLPWVITEGEWSEDEDE